jgi:hypothetical protein
MKHAPMKSIPEIKKRGGIQSPVNKRLRVPGTPGKYIYNGNIVTTPVKVACKCTLNARRNTHMTILSPAHPACVTNQS